MLPCKTGISVWQYFCIIDHTQMGMWVADHTCLQLNNNLMAMAACVYMEKIILGKYFLYSLVAFNVISYLEGKEVSLCVCQWSLADHWLQTGKNCSRTCGICKN